MFSLDDSLRRKMHFVEKSAEWVAGDDKTKSLDFNKVWAN